MNYRYEKKNYMYLPAMGLDQKHNFDYTYIALSLA